MKKVVGFLFVLTFLSTNVVGQTITINFKNISLINNFTFDAGNIKMILNTTVDQDEFEIRTKFYQQQEKTTEVGGWTLIKGCEEVDPEIPEGMLEKEIIFANTYTIITLFSGCIFRACRITLIIKSFKSL